MILRVVGQDLQNTGAGSAAAISASTLSLSELLRLDAFIASMPCKKGTKSNAVLFTICFLELLSTREVKAYRFLVVFLLFLHSINVRL